MLYPHDHGLEGLDNYTSMVCLNGTTNIIGSDVVDGDVNYDGNE